MTSVRRLLAFGALALGTSCDRTEPPLHSQPPVDSASTQQSTSKGPTSGDGHKANPGTTAVDAAAVTPGSASGAAPSGTAAVEVAGARLSLADKGGKCVLQRVDKDEASWPLPLDAPCSFHFDKEGRLRTRERENRSILLIETSEPIPDTRDCKTRVLAVAVGAGGVEIAPAPANVAMCLPFMWDDVMFFGPLER